MAFLDFVRESVGNDPVGAFNRFSQVLQEGAQAITSARPSNLDAAPMASGQIVNPLQRFIDVLHKGAQGRAPTVSIGASAPPPTSPPPSSSPTPQNADAINAKLRGMNLPVFLGLDRSSGEPKLPEALQKRSLGNPTKPTTPEERLSGSTFQVPTWINTLDESQLQMAAQDPSTAMRFVLRNSGLDTDSPAGNYFLERAPAIANLYQVQSGAFLDDGGNPSGLMTYMQAWVDKMTASTSTPGQQVFSDNMKQQASHKADEILSTIEPGTPGEAFRAIVASETGSGFKSEPEVYWERLIEPALTARRLTASALRGRQAQFKKLAAEYQDAQFEGTAPADFGLFLVQKGFRLEK